MTVFDAPKFNLTGFCEYNVKMDRQLIMTIDLLSDLIPILVVCFFPSLLVIILNSVYFVCFLVC